MQHRCWLDVPYRQKDRAKGAGARWDPTARRWYAPGDTIPPALARWAPVPVPREPADTSTTHGEELGEPAPESVESPVEMRVEKPAWSWVHEGWEDLAARPPGYAVSGEATRRRSGDGDDASWRQGADGEARLAAALDGLVAPRGLARITRRGPAWRVLHSVPIGRGRADVDHLLIGPPGVITINTKHHGARRRVDVGPDEITVGGRRTEHVRKARAEADRVARLLASAAAAHHAAHLAGPGAHSRADGSRRAEPIMALPHMLIALAEGRRPDLGPGAWPPVRAALAIVGAPLHGRDRPHGVLVATPKSLPRLLSALPAQLDEPTADAVYALARRSTTWTRAT